MRASLRFGTPLSSPVNDRVRLKFGSLPVAQRTVLDAHAAVRTSPALAVSRVSTVPNAITAARTVGGVALAAAALAEQSSLTLLAAHLVYWVGDMADGVAARLLGQETRIGAVFDIVADRANCLLCAAALVVLHPDLAVQLSVYVVEFAVVDTGLSLGFLAFPVMGHNDMHLVDRSLWRWNWSRAAKAANTSVVVVLCAADRPILATAAACIVLAVKTGSCRRLRRLLAARSGQSFEYAGST